MNARIRIVLAILLVAALTWIIPQGICFADNNGSSVYETASQNGTTASDEAVSRLSGDTDDQTFLDDAFDIIFMRTPTPYELRYWTERLSAGVPRINIISEMTSTVEFNSNCATAGVEPGAVVTEDDSERYIIAAQFVDRLSISTIGHIYPCEERQIWIDFLADGLRSATDIAYSFVFSSECVDRTADDGDFVRVLFEAVSPDEPDQMQMIAAEGMLASGMDREKLFETMVGREEFATLCERYQVAQGQYSQSRPIDPDRPMIALTFDDGPSQYTARILDCLEKYGQAATFFVVGTNAEIFQETMARADRLGCEIGNHTWGHPNLTNLGADEITSQLLDTDRYVMSATGHLTTLLRPPYGSYNDLIQEIAGKPLILWNVDTRDWETRDRDSTVTAILDTVADGDIVLMHDIYEPTADAVLEAVPVLIERGYQLVTVSELAEYRGGMENGGAYFRFRPTEDS